MDIALCCLCFKELVRTFDPFTDRGKVMLIQLSVTLHAIVNVICAKAGFYPDTCTIVQRFDDIGYTSQMRLVHGSQASGGNSGSPAQAVLCLHDFMEYTGPQIQAAVEAQDTVTGRSSHSRPSREKVSGNQLGKFTRSSFSISLPETWDTSRL
jgi:hypothetical protein